MTAAFHFQGGVRRRSAWARALADAFQPRAVFDKVDAALGDSLPHHLGQPGETLQLTENTQRR